MARTGTQSGNLTWAQQQIWVGQKLAPEAPLYNTPFTFRIRGPLDRARFETAFRQCVEACDALRTVFEERHGEPSRVVRADLEVPLEYVDLSAHPRPEAAARSLISERCRRLFPMTSRLIDTILVRLSSGDHIWFLNQHHLITDAWSTSLLFRQVEARYRSLGSGRRVPAPPSFEAYALEESRRRAESEEGSAPARQGPASRTRPAADLYGRGNEARSTASERRTLELGAARSRRLGEIAREPGVRSLTPGMSRFNIFATIVAALLYRVTGETRSVFGTPVLNRLSPELQQTLGLFVELHPFAAPVAHEDSFEDLLSRVQREGSRLLLGARPGSAEAAALRGFHVVFNYLTVSFPSFDGNPVEVDWWHPGHSDAGHHLWIQVHDLHASGGLSVLFDFNCSVFPEERRAWVMHHFSRLLDSFVEDRAQRVADVDLVHPQERSFLLARHSASGRWPAASSLTREFERVVRERPEAKAVTAADGSLTYANLDARANDIARRLLDAGVAPGDKVGLAAARSTATLCGLVGILKARAAYLPLAPGSPATRTSLMLDDAGVEIVIAAEPVPGWDGRRIDPGESRGLDSPALTPAAADDLAYVLYTSGSTGRPKGVLVEHRQVLSLVSGLERRVFTDEPPGLRVAMLAPFSFDASVQQIFATLLLGHELVLVPAETRLDGAALLDFFHGQDIDLADGTPAHLSLLSRAPGGPDFTRVRHFLIGGEELRPAVLRAFYQRFPDGDPIVTNVYGPTECCVDSTSFRVTRHSLDRLDAGVPIGRPLPGERVYVMSGSALQPLGAPGELCIAGSGVARGYQGRREGGRAFAADPFFAGERLYRSGDFGRYRRDGEIEFLGRRDSQVKVRGYRIELGEVESALASFERHVDGARVEQVPQAAGHPRRTIDEVAVVAREDEPGDGRTLCAYFTSKHELTVRELRAHLAATLPHYMIPQHFVQLPAIPLTDHGKIDTAALPAPVGTQLATGEKAVSPATETEKFIVEVWSEVLDIPVVDVRRSFFEYGGASLQAMDVMARICAALDITLSLQELFAAPTVRELADRVDRILEKELASLGEDELAGSTEKAPRPSGG